MTTRKSNIKIISALLFWHMLIVNQIFTEEKHPFPESTGVSQHKVEENGEKKLQLEAKKKVAERKVNT